MSQLQQPVSPALQLLYDLLEKRRTGEEPISNEKGYLELQGQDYREANLIGLDLSNCDFTDCNFSRARLVKTTFDHCRLKLCDFGGANLSHASLEHVQAVATNFSNANCQHMKATSGQFNGTIFANTFLWFANFSFTDLSNCTFSPGFLQAKTYTDATGAQFTGACCQDTDLSGVWLEQSSFAHAQLLHTNFDGADITGVDFKGAEINNVDFSKAIRRETKP